MFEHLDDPEPFNPTNHMRDAVQRRASALRHRRALVPGVALVAVAALVIGATGAARDTGTRVRAVAAPPATRPAPITVKMQGIQVKVALNKRTYAPNEVIRVKLTAENTSGATKALRFVVCLPTGRGARPAAKCSLQVATVRSPGSYRATVAQRAPEKQAAYFVEIARGNHVALFGIRVGKVAPCQVAYAHDLRDSHTPLLAGVVTDARCTHARSKP